MADSDPLNLSGAIKTLILFSFISVIAHSTTLLFDEIELKGNYNTENKTK
jgi:hypothetical protein